MRKLCILALVFLCLFACTKKESGKVLAKIDDETITLEEFNKELDKIPTNMKMLVVSPEGKKTYLDRLIMKRLVLREAKKEKIEEEKEFKEKLNEIREQLILETLLKKKILANAKITDDDMKKYYEANKEKFKKNKEINTRHILVRTDEEARQVIEKLKKGEDFVELARTYSIDPNARTTGGEIGFHPQGSLVKEYEEAVAKLKKPGDVSGIVKTQFGFHIIRLEGVKPPAYVPFDEVKDFIKQNMTQAKQGELIEKYIEELKKNAKITKNEDLLKGEEKPADKTKPEGKKENVSPAKDVPPAKSEAAPKKDSVPGKEPVPAKEAPAKK